MSSQHDYSIYYGRFHDDSESHAATMAGYMTGVLTPYLPADKDTPTLDVGCGFGFALRALRTLGYSRLSGVEMSPQQADRANRAGFAVALTDDTIGWLGQHRAEFGLILLLDVIEHIPVAAQIDFLRAVRGALRPGGRLIITTPNANSPLSARWRYNDYTHASSFTEHSLFYVLKNAGFDTVNIPGGHGVGRMPRRLWRRDARMAWRRWMVRWCWLQVHKAEIPWEKLDEISFELNLTAVGEVAAANPEHGRRQ